MKSLPRRFRDDSSSRIGTYEAFLDLLTLFCFILMFAAAIYIAQPVSSGMAEVAVQDAVRGATPAALPDGQVELKVSKEGTVDRLTVLDGVTGRTFAFEIISNNVSFELDSVRPSLLTASNIYLAVFEDTQPVNSGVVFEIQRWLSYNEFGRYKFYFIQPK